MDLTIQQALDQLSDLGQEIGFSSKICGWYLGSEELQPLEKPTVSSIKIGNLDQTHERIAYIHLTRP
jgi:hypothetical protein